MNEEKKEQEDDGIGVGGLLTIMIIIGIVTVGFVVYNAMQEPYRIADELEDRLNDMDDVSDEYKQGWKDCISNYLDITTSPTNSTSDLIAKEVK